MQKFVIIASQRTGSTLLRTLLDSHPQIACGREILYAKMSKPLKEYMGSTTARILGYYFSRKKVIYGFLDAFYENCEGMKAAGFKFMYSQASIIPYRFPMFLSYVKDRNIKVIHNLRHNLLKTHLSQVNAQLKKLHHSNQKLKFEKIHVHVSNLLPTLERMLEEQNAWQENLKVFETFDVIYENLIKNKEQILSHVLKFLEVRADVALQSPMKKISPNRIRDIVSNYHEIVFALKGTQFEHFLD